MSRWLLLVLGLLVVSPALAHPIGRGNPYTVDVEDANGNPLRTFDHEGQTYVLGEYGARYNIRVRNRTGQRIEVVATVDGRDVISGREGDYVKERGYVLRPYGDVLIEGFRTSEQSVAAFRFTNPGNSYSSRMGTPQNVGIIGVAVFRERAPIVRRPTRRTQEYNNYRGRDDGEGMWPQAEKLTERSMAPSTSAPAADSATAGLGALSRGRGHSSGSASGESRARRDSPSNLGTEYGEARDSHVTSTRFVRANSSRPTAVISLRYDDENGLLARGIRVHPMERDSYAGPLAFPRNRFAPPPP